MTWDEIAAQADVALLVVRDGALACSNVAARRLVEPYGSALPDVLDRVAAVQPGARTTTVRWPSPTGGTRWWDVICYPLAPSGSLYVIVDETVEREVLLGRLGGDEFAVIVPDTTPRAAMELAETLCARIGHTPFGGVAGIRVTISVGVAMVDPSGAATADVETALAHADLALYEAKRTGRMRAPVHPRAVRRGRAAGVGAAAGGGGAGGLRLHPRRLRRGLRLLLPPQEPAVHGGQDRGGVRAAGRRGPRRPRLITAVVGVARQLGMRTVAEHVDRRAMVAHLRALGVDDGQGYLLGRPTPLTHLVE